MMKDEENGKWDEYTISKDAMALIRGLQKQREMLIAQLSVIDAQAQNMVRIIAQSFVGDDVIIPNGVEIKTDFENCKLMIEKFSMVARVPIRNPPIDSKGPIGPEE